MCDAGLVADKASYSMTPDVYKFDEDNSDALSPEQPASQETTGSISDSPRESGGSEADSTSSQLNSSIQVHHYLETITIHKTNGPYPPNDLIQSV